MCLLHYNKKEKKYKHLTYLSFGILRKKWSNCSLPCQLSRKTDMHRPFFSNFHTLIQGIRKCPFFNDFVRTFSIIGMWFVYIFLFSLSFLILWFPFWHNLIFLLCLLPLDKTILELYFLMIYFDLWFL